MKLDVQNLKSVNPLEPLENGRILFSFSALWGRSILMSGISGMEDGNMDRSEVGQCPADSKRTLFLTPILAHIQSYATKRVLAGHGMA